MLFVFQVLHTRQEDKRAAAVEKILALGEKYERDTLMVLFRANCMKNQYMVRGAGSHARGAHNRSDFHAQAHPMYGPGGMRDYEVWKSDI